MARPNCCMYDPAAVDSLEESGSRDRAAALRRRDRRRDRQQNWDGAHGLRAGVFADIEFHGDLFSTRLRNYCGVGMGDGFRCVSNEGQGIWFESVVVEFGCVSLGVGFGDGFPASDPGP